MSAQTETRNKRKMQPKAHRNFYRVLMSESYDQDYIEMVGGKEQFNAYIKQNRMTRRKCKNPISFPPRENGESASWEFIHPFITKRDKVNGLIEIQFAVCFSSYSQSDAEHAAKQIAREFGKASYTISVCEWKEVKRVS